MKNENSEDWAPSAVENPTLLKKYDLPISHLDFEYVEKCKNPKEMEKIVHVLQSGEEGYFPALLKRSEERLALLKPNSKFIRRSSQILNLKQLHTEEQSKLKTDLNEFIQNVRRNNVELRDLKKFSASYNEYPAIRETYGYKQDTKTKKPERIKATDYQQWDKYDPDTELLKMEIADEKIKREAAKKPPSQRKVKFNNIHFHTKAEAIFHSNKEREKGNEFFKLGEYQNALVCYTNSILYAPSVSNYNNRAITHIKLSKYNEAIEDCQKALKYEPNNLKALLRMSQCYDALNNGEMALQSAERIIQIDPNNLTAQNIINKFDQLQASMPKTRLKIVDYQENTPPKKSILKQREVLVPIPGPSSMSEPYFIVCDGKRPDVIREQEMMLNSRPQLLHFTNVYDDNDSDCDVIHIMPKGDGDLDSNSSSNNINSSHSLDEEIYERIECINIMNKHKSSDNGAGGEPHQQTPNQQESNVEMPYSFLQMWKSIDNDDTSYIKHAEILRGVDANRLNEIFSYKLDGSMLNTILCTLYMHFTVPHEVDKVHQILANLCQVARFNLAKMFLTKNDRNHLKCLFAFLEQHGRPLSNHLINLYTN